MPTTVRFPLASRDILLTPPVANLSTPEASVIVQSPKSTVVAPTSAGIDVATSSTEDAPFNDVVYQTGSTTCKRITDEQESEYFDIYAKTHGDPPARAQQPTIEQLSCVKALIFLLFQIYVDFAVFVQFGNRLLKRIKLSGQAIGPDGVLRPFEIFGPPTIQDLVPCYRVFRVLLSYL